MNISPAKTLILFFLGLIITGTIILSLPISVKGANSSLLINLFTSASAVCVTGLSIVSIGNYYSTFGQIVVLFLVQMGGLGYMFISTVIAVVAGKMMLKDRRIMQDIFDIKTFKNLKKLLVKAGIFVFGIEFAGAVLLSICFLKDNSFLKAVYLGIFYSITAFCNAGFSLFDDSLMRFSGNFPILFIMAVLIISGGLGFFVLVDIYDTYKEKHAHFLTHTKVVLLATVFIVIFGFLFFIFYEKAGIANSFFQAVSFRTAGFSSIEVKSISGLGKLIFMVIMSIGASPASTAGGLKVTTVVVILASIRSFIRSDESVTIFKRRLSDDIVKKASMIFILFFSSIVVLSMALIIAEPDKNPIDLVFEIISAFSTAGLSINITPNLNTAGKILDIIAMIAGRIGITTLLIFTAGKTIQQNKVKYPQADIFVG